MRGVLKSENIAFFLLVLYIYFISFNYSLVLFLSLLFIFDLSMIGYLVNTKFGAILYNLFHNLIPPIILLLIGLFSNSDLLIAFSLIWLAHIFMDRTIGFGLKYLDGFTHTHLS